MTIQKVQKLEIEIQKQTMDNPGSKYFILIKSEKGKKNLLKILTTNKKPIVKFYEDNGRIVVDKTNV